MNARATEVNMELSSRHIEDKRFTKALRGYDRQEVDTFVTDCAAHTSSLEERTKIAEVRAAASEKELAELRADIDVLLEEASDARRTIIEEAKAEAVTIVRQADAAGRSVSASGAATQAAAIISEAEVAAKLRLDAVDDVQQVADEKAANTLRVAEESAAMTQAEADRLLGKARLDASAIREETEALRTSMEAQLAEIRRLLEAARSGDVEVEGIMTAQDSEFVIDLREGATKPESHHVTG